MKFTKEDLHQLFIDLIAEEKNLDASQIKVEAEFYAHGLDSISAIHILDQLENRLNIEINPLDFWDYPTIDKLSTYLLENKLS